MKRFFINRDGATAIEYALIAGMISIVILTAVASVGEEVVALFTLVSSGFQAAQ
jgi:pilus assembly protein Flp/PilA